MTRPPTGRRATERPRGASAASARADLPHLDSIDGVRGIGVTIVLLFHSGVSALTGAFLNIDMFFVTSGALITLILLGEHDRRGRIDLPRFWMNRARRLLPALFGMLLLVAVYARFIADPTTVGGIRKDMLATLGFYANWHFIRDGEPYFATAQTVSPLLHTWSLAIEEQFYLAWPILLSLWLWLRRGSTRFLAPVLFLLSVASAVWMGVSFDPYLDPSRYYYDTFMRAQALLLGCATAVWLHAHRSRLGRRTGRKPRAYVRIAGRDVVLPDAMGWAGIAGLLVMLVLPFLVNERSTWVFKGGFFIASAAAALVGVSLLTDGRTWLSRSLASGPLPVIGKCSYGLYVWHFPIIVILDETRTGLTGWALVALRMAVVFAVAFPYDRFVERPIRRGALKRLPSPMGGISAVASAMAMVMVTIASTAHAQPQVFGTALPGFISTVTGPIKPDQRRVVILGDSVAFTLWKFFPQEQHPGISVGSSTQLGCGVAIPQHLYIGTYLAPDSTHCAGYETRWRKLVEAADPEAVVLLSGSAELFDRKVDGHRVRNPSPEYDRIMYRAYSHAVDVAGGPEKRLVLLADIPCYGRRDKVDAGMAQRLGIPADQLDAAERTQNDPARQERLNRVLARIDRERDNVQILGMRGWLCPSGQFQEEIDGVVVRPDGVHLDEQSVPMWWNRFWPEMEAAMGPHRRREVIGP